MKSIECSVDGVWNQEKQAYEVSAHDIAVALGKVAKEEDLKFRREVKQILPLEDDEALETKLAALQMKNSVLELYRASIMGGQYPWRSPDAVIGEALGFDICYRKESIDFHENEIADLLSNLKPLENYLDLAILASGKKWTEARQPINLLLSLANAAGLLDFDRQAVLDGNDNPQLIQHKKNDIIL